MPWRAALVLLTVVALSLVTGTAGAPRDAPSVSVSFLPADQVNGGWSPPRHEVEPPSPAWDGRGGGIRY